MKIYDFDEIIDRRNSGAIKTDALEERFGNKDLIPLWVADMDFRTPDFIVNAIRKRCDHEVFGYTQPSENYTKSIIRWVDQRHDWKIEKEWLSYIPGIVKGIALCIMNFSKPGDKIIIQPPVYHPFRIIPEKQKRKVVNNPLVEENGMYRMDFDQLEQIIDPDCKLLVLSNPHNPAGLTWDKETLVRLAEICHRNNILVISDEIHADMALFGNHHIPFATVSEEARSNSITFMAPSKAFNIAGIVSSYAIVPDDKIRENFFQFLEASEMNEAPIFSYIATQAAYENGSDWLHQMLQYIESNISFVDLFLKTNLPKIKAIIPQASFLIWLDCRELGLSQSDLISLFVDKAGLALNDGCMFGPGGEGFMRLNVGCPKSVIKRALENLESVF